ETITVHLSELYSLDYTAYYLDEEFLIDVVIANVTRLSSFKFKLGYNTTLLNAINVTEGPFLKSFESTSTTMEIHDPEGYVLINIALLASTPPADGNGILATIKFRVTYATVYPETVACDLDLIDTELNDPTGQPIPHTVIDGWYQFVPPPPQPPCIGPAIDIYTQKLDPYSGKGPNMPSDSFGPQEKVILYAYVSHNCEPIQNKLVVFEVKNPSDEPVIFRTATSNTEGIATSSFRIPWEAEEAESLFGEWIIYGSVEISETKVNDTCTFKFGWLIEATQVKTADTYGSPKSSFTKGEHIHFNITIKNMAFTSKIATFTLTVYDECDVPIGHVVLHDWLIPSGTTEIFIGDLQIPKWAYVGVGTAYANAYTDLPQICGTPYCPEILTTFMITKP
ncbi:MAG: cohesin domain-containing protein, partial [Candidatus Bathyarchaeota archaeon]|nr:cohesin domain-containing protein [Candidatus Bathyarchaeota archaeon]